MKIVKKIQIEKPAAEVWKVLGEDFEKADQWMSGVFKSYAKSGGEALDGAPVYGRICEVTTKSDGAIANETILQYDANEQNIVIEVLLENGPAVLPIIKNIADFRVKSLGQNRSEVIWESNVHLKPLGYAMYPLVRMGINKNFDEILEELKYYVETGTIHPRKAKKLEKAALVAA